MGGASSRDRESKNECRPTFEIIGQFLVVIGAITLK
jgi:hypothetical protein